jgi:MFS family permease
MWQYKNFGIVITLGLLPIMWWASMQFVFSWLWQQVYGYSAVQTAIRLLPLLCIVFIAGPTVDILQKKLPLKRVINIGHVLVLIGTVILPFANTKERYFSFVIPGFIIASSGNLFVLAAANTALFHAVPTPMAGTAAAIFSCANQLGSATGSAIIASIAANVGDPQSFDGRAAGIWFLFALNAVAAVFVLAFMKYVPPAGQSAPKAEESARASTEEREEKDAELATSTSGSAVPAL